MWITEEVDLPYELIIAQQEKRLVIFAGAGISVAQPSNLPLFDKLAEQVSGGAFLRMENDGQKEPIDRYLGRLQNQGIQIHERTQRIIGSPASLPVPLHNDLLSLFPSPQETRIVTTNFDRHFTSVASPETIIHYAPGLPLGRRFNGIVYLHGSVDRDAQSLVLTDSDFGKAYLTDGWATRFLWEVFSEYVVLFIGYSHDDPVMHYLSRGLAPEQSYQTGMTSISGPTRKPLLRFAFTKPGRKDHWEFLGIRPIEYPVRDNEHDHSALNRAVEAWVLESKTTWTNHEEKIKKIVESGPPTRNEAIGYINDDYLSFAVRSPERARFFIRYARGVEWLRWAEEKGILDHLFCHSSDTNDVDEIFAKWLAEQYAVDHVDASIALLARHGQILNRLAWLYISHELARRNPFPESSIISRWVTILVGALPHGASYLNLAEIFKRCRFPEDIHSSLLLLGHLTQPIIALSESPSWHPEEEATRVRVSADIKLRGGEYSYNIKSAWERFFLPNLQSVNESLLPLLIGHITQAYEQLLAARELHSEYDPLSFSRHAIEPHEQDNIEGNIDLLITMLRDTVDWLNTYQPNRAIEIAIQLANSSQRLLQRIALHIMINTTVVASDSKLEWLLNNHYLKDIYLRHEVYELLASAIFTASENMQKVVLDEAEASFPEATDEENGEEIKAYKMLDMLVWLNNKNSGCKVIEERLDHLRNVFPDFIPSEHPDLLIYTMTGFVDNRSPVTINELISMDYHEAIELLITFTRHWSTELSREGLLITLFEAVSNHFSWSLTLAKTLASSNEWKEDVWCRIISGWGKSLQTVGQWEKVFDIIEDHGDLLGISKCAAELLREAASNTERPLPVACFGRARTFVRQLLTLAVSSTQPDDDQQRYNSTWDSIGGKVTEFWLLTTYKNWNRRNSRVGGLAPVDRRFFDAILSGGDGREMALARMVLARHVSILFHIDHAWTIAKLLPLFDWNQNNQEARRVWNVFPSSFQIDLALITEMMPMIRSCFGQLHKLGEDRKKLLCDFLAMLAVQTEDDHKLERWLWEFLLNEDEQSRVSWADRIRYRLEEIGHAAAADQWQRWIQAYWDDRNTGVPVPLSEAEKAEMLDWRLPLDVVFPEVVVMICATPAPEVGSNSMLFSFIYREPTTAKYPNDTAYLVLHLLKNKDQPLHPLEGDVNMLVSYLSKNGANKSVLAAICEEMARLGDESAIELKRAIAK